MFDESTHVPLMIYHPSSPARAKGIHYPHPVELVDVYPTLLDLMQLPRPTEREPCFLTESPRRCVALDGTSLASVVLDTTINDNTAEIKQRGGPTHSQRQFAVTQVTRCAQQKVFARAQALPLGSAERVHIESSMWYTCLDDDVSSDDIIALLGYSMRSELYRYTAYFRYNLTGREVILLPISHPDSIIHTPNKNIILFSMGGIPYNHDANVVYEELYDHRFDSRTPLVEREISNIAQEKQYSAVVEKHYNALVEFIIFTQRQGIRKLRKREKVKKKRNQINVGSI